MNANDRGESEGGRGMGGDVLVNELVSVSFGECCGGSG